jgi:hypothetical protein
VVNDGEVDMVKTVTGALALTPVLASVAARAWLPACAGAVYKPAVLTTPTEEFPPAMLSTDQVMEGFERAGKLALNCCVAPPRRVAEAGETELGLVTVTVELALFVVSATLVAVTVCVPVAGGALYRPETSISPLVALPPTTVSTDQVTAVFVVPVTLAVNCMVVPAATSTEDC